ALVAAAAWLRGRRAEVAALEVRECAKPWAEADADVCEAIDFLEFYARGALSLDAGRPLLQVPGERNEMRYVPRGVCGVIAPWNFPVAIPMGMVAAALVTGNTAVLKPAEQAPGCGLVVVRALREGGGVPDEALALLPGEGDTGAALVRHPLVHVIAFTGSAPVGLEILRAAGDTPEEQRHLKRVVAEMGGKNCVLVDGDVDPPSPLLREEVFGPLLTVERARDLDEAVARVDELRFALTGGLFSRNPRTVDEVAARLPVGNLYVNRAITGAMVARQPFGGNRISGTGTKAGGPDYLLSFVAAGSASGAASGAGAGSVSRSVTRYDPAIPAPSESAAHAGPLSRGKSAASTDAEPGPCSARSVSAAISTRLYS